LKVPDVAEAGITMARKGRARRFREARELKKGYDDGLFDESGRSLAEAEAGDPEPNWRDENNDLPTDWDDDDPLLLDQGGRPPK
jgi:hypothetical protein